MKIFSKERLGEHLEKTVEEFHSLKGFENRNNSLWRALNLKALSGGKLG